MNDATTDDGLIQVLLERLEKYRLPRLLEIQKKVDGGNPLEDFDLEFMEMIMSDAQKLAPLIDRNPEYHALSVKVVMLYKDITDKALEIEKKS